MRGGRADGRRLHLLLLGVGILLVLLLLMVVLAAISHHLEKTLPMHQLELMVRVGPRLDQTCNRNDRDTISGDVSTGGAAQQPQLHQQQQ
ncbi:hypothetical protein BJY04DRAFT_196263 [Aspergillus karnatakaensis]|uniref:uncharacterized protein n=1 Tax=Aspergillus karnatakaensis TaxID=1810916 RepID=UPI003CCE13F4